MKNFALSLLTILSLTAFSQKYPQDYFRSPLEIPLVLSGTFGELRTNHFHSGMDIKTQGREGQRVVAIAEGTVVRIKVSPYGFGNALYVRHPNGYTSVYAHLQRYNDEIQAYVLENQYQNESFAVELFPPAGKFQYEQGDLLALSGNSGGSGGPHLHFEIRDTRTENIINPLLFGFDVKDDIAPLLYNMEIYQFEDNQLVSSDTRNLVGAGGNTYGLAGDDLIIVQNPPAFGITTYDKLNGAANKNGIYSIKMWISGEPYYDYQMETFAFAETRYINSHIDYGLKQCCRRNVNKLYIEPGNQLSTYSIKEKMKLPDLVPDSIYEVKIAVNDVAGNVSELLFNLKYEPQPQEELAADEEVPASVFRYGQSNYFTNNHINMVLPEGALYDDVYFEYERKAPCASCYSYIHQVAAREIPVQKYYTLKIKPDATYDGDRSKLCIASFRNGNMDDYEGGRWENGYVVAHTRQFGEFAIYADDTPPQVSALNFSDGSTLSKSARLRFKITDNFSGIKSYRGEVDGEWVLFQYDAKSRLLYADVAEWPVESGSKTLTMAVTDERGNRTEKSYKIVLP